MSEREKLFYQNQFDDDIRWDGVENGDRHREDALSPSADASMTMSNCPI